MGRIYKRTVGELVAEGKEKYYCIASKSEAGLNKEIVAIIRDMIKTLGYSKGGGEGSEEVEEIKKYLRCLEQLALGTSGAGAFGSRKRRKK